MSESLPSRAVVGTARAGTILETLWEALCARRTGYGILILWFGLIAFYGFFALSYYPRAEGLFDSTGHPIGRDFVNYWTGSVLALTGRVAEIFDLERFHALQQQLLGRPFHFANWSYPPPALFFVLPLGLVPYLWAYLLWSAATLGLYLLAVVDRRWGGLRMAALILAPASFVNLIAGQNGFLTAALLVGGMRLLDKRPLVAGVLLGLLSFKPQLGLLVPVALIAAGLWRPFLGAAVTVLALAALSLGVFGLESWQAYFETIVPFQKHILTETRGLHTLMMPTALNASRLLGLDITVGYAIQTVFTVCAGLCVAIAFRRGSDRKMQTAVLLLATLLAAPYAHNYDLTLASVAVLWAFERAERSGFLPGEGLLMALVWSLPLLVMVANGGGWPVAPALLAAFLLLLLARAKGWLRNPAGAGPTMGTRP